MADDKRGREKQARDEANRQRERDVSAYLARGDEPEPPVEPAELTELERDLEDVDFPATSADVVEAVGDREVASTGATYALADLLPETDVETFDAPDAVRVRVERPTIAAALKRILDAASGLPNADPFGSKREAYVKTLVELKAIDADDEDEGIRAITDWIVDRTEANGALPRSRDVRREAAKFCRESGYEVRNDEWLGI